MKLENHCSRSAFTMVELVFVIVVIGILAAVAVPKMAASRDDATIVKGMDTIAAARSALSTERQKRILQGITVDMNSTDVGNNFAELLEYDVTECSTDRCGGWSTSGNVYTFHGPTGDVAFTLTDNKLNCTTSSDRCEEYNTKYVP
jgi:general secretion pathway protein G